MKVLITGASGTLGSAMVKYLESINAEVFSWERSKVSPFIYSEMKNYIEEIDPDIIFHFAIASQGTGIENESWKINYEWTSELAWISNEHKIKFLFTSTAMVFSDLAKGPFTKNSIPDASSGYGFEKLKAEERVFCQNSDAYVARLGWQISDKFSGNNMLAYFDNEMKNKGVLKASNKWYPACSFVSDTVKELFRIVREESPGLYMIDSNDAYTFYELALWLNKKHNNRWKIEQDDSFSFEQRMIDNKTQVKKLSTIF